MQYTDFVQQLFEDRQASYETECIFDLDYDSQLEDLAAQYARILAEKHVSEGKTSPSCADERLYPNGAVYRYHFAKVSEDDSFLEF